MNQTYQGPDSLSSLFLTELQIIISGKFRCLAFIIKELHFYKQRCSNINTCVCDPGFMGRACDMPSDIIDMPTLSPEITPPPDEQPSATVSHTHIRK